ncbi:MAG: DUF3800 domain-containing protein [Candidatus Levybacteria bacterium]|nr:DUF3800 domain-containing protein [Candidatus Levybacteria bacterium]
MLVFIDDSGDPGFKIEKGSSKVFIIALVIFNDSLEAEKTSLAIKELRRKLKVSDLYEFKFNKTNSKFKKQFFNCVKSFKYKIRAIVVKKEAIYSSRLKNYKENFYNYIIMQVLRHNGGLIKKAKLKFDRRGEKVIRNELRAYLSRELDNKNKLIFKELKFVDSRQNTLIQLADMVAGSIYSFHMDKTKEYLKILEEFKRIDDIWVFK